MQPDWQPKTLQNERILFFPLKENHFEELYAVANDKLLWEQHPNKLRYQRDAFRNFFDGALLSNGAFIIRDKQTNEAIGSSRFYDYDEKSSTVLIGYTFIGRQFWGKGFNLAMKKVMLDYAFQFVYKVQFHVGATNIRSQKSIEKIGVIKITELEVAYYGEPSKLNFVYEITKKND